MMAVGHGKGTVRQEKVCAWCLRQRPLEEFNKKARSKDGKQPYCRDCNRARCQKNYHENREHHIAVSLAARRRRRALIKARIEAVKGHNGCALCPECDPVCLEFHHTDPREKDFDIGSFPSGSWKWSIIAREMRKCVVLCSNCHKKVHAGKKAVDDSMRCTVDAAICLE